MATDENTNPLNVKDLTEIDEIINGHKILIEIPDGTRVIDFQNFIIGLGNTTFGNTITGNSADIAALSAKVISLSAQVDIEIDSAVASMSAANRFHFDKAISTSINANGSSTITFATTMPSAAQVNFTKANCNVVLGSTPTMATSGWSWHVSSVTFAGNNPQINIVASGGGATGTITLLANIFVPY